MAFADPQQNISNFHLKEGMKVADFGAGVGAYSFALAKRVGGKGRVYAIDVQKDLINKLRNDARAQNLYNVEVVWGNLDEPNGTKLASQSVDAVLISNVLFQSEHRQAMLLEAKRVLKPGGELMIIDWSGSFGGIGPAPDHIIPQPKTQEMAESAGFKFANSFFAGEHHYGLLFTS